MKNKGKNMTFIYEIEMNRAPLQVEYTISSVTNGIKIVDMYYDGQPHRASYMAEEHRLNLMNELERDYLNRSGN